MNSDVVIVGGGAMGSSTAYHLLAADPSLSVTVVERDNSYEHASTVLSDGNVRIQFNLEENIRISQHAFEVFETFGADMETGGIRPDVAARHQGNLFLTDESGVETARAGLETQLALGCPVEWLDLTEIAERFPLLQARGIPGGTHGPKDGSVDPTAVLRGYRAKAIELGADYLEAEASSLSFDGGNEGLVALNSGDSITARHVVVAGGAWTHELLRTVGIDIPVDPVMRTVYVVSTPSSSSGIPSLFLPSGVYALAEGEHTWLVGWSRDEDPIGFDFTPASRERFEDLIWPALVEHLPIFEQLTVERSWAGLYAVNRLDGNGIIGRWPEIACLYLATGFSGHGFQQCPAVGRYLAEQMLDSKHVLDLGRLGPQRIINKEPLYEHAGRLI